MGTASTMACVTAALGLIPLQGASAPAVSAARLRIAEQTGSNAVAAARFHRAPQEILSTESFYNAAVVLQAFDPFRSGKLVLYQVHYSIGWHGFELLPYAILGVMGVSPTSSPNRTSN